MSRDEKNFLLVQRQLVSAHLEGDHPTELQARETLGDFFHAPHLHRAMMSDDDEMCECGPSSLQTEMQNLSEPRLIPSHQEMRRIWSEKHEGPVSEWRCLSCGHTNLTPSLPCPHSQRITEARALKTSRLDFDILSNA